MGDLKSKVFNSKITGQYVSKVDFTVGWLVYCLVEYQLGQTNFNLLLLGYCEVKIGPSDRKKSNHLGCGYRPQSN